MTCTSKTRRASWPPCWRPPREPTALRSGARHTASRGAVPASVPSGWRHARVINNEEGDDVIAIRHMAYFALSFDHRIIDGADAERFLSYVKELLEAGQFTV
ncbi:MAG: hypothetical protein DMF65_11960 [Acidobacteria bacterium]|nr:MAG: hypothetical protein DMF65_11960 [Acidobacteriota bacterium]